VARTISEVEQVRGLEFLKPVQAEAVTHGELVSRLSRFVDLSYPEELFDRRSTAWQTIGVMPADVDIREAVERFSSAQVIGFYDPAGEELVFIGTEDPTAVQRVTLAHELTHAIDDQHFDLDRLNTLEARCQDEALTAAIGAVEGSAQLFSFQVAQRFFTSEERQELLGSGGGDTGDVPEFIFDQAIWPYVAGLRFMTARLDDGGLEAVNEALRNFPVSTEQVIHPEKYPDDQPQPVAVPDVAAELGPGWEDLDIMVVGESWLDSMLDLRLDATTAREAAAGWDGGRYRAWTDGEHVALVLQTVWDSNADAADFAGAIGDWFEEGQKASVQEADGGVVVLFASDAATLAVLESSAAVLDR
jgi:hypothetical protein